MISNAFKQILFSRINYLLQHLVFLKQIEKKYIPTQDIQDFLYDVFQIDDNFKIDLVEFHTVGLPVFTQFLQARFNYFRKLDRIANNRIQDETSLSTLYFLIDLDLKACALQSTTSRSENKFFLEDSIILQELKIHLTPFLPKSFAILNDNIVIQKSNKCIYKDKQYIGTHNSFVLVTKWDRFFEKMLENVRILDQANYMMSDDILQQFQSVAFILQNKVQEKTHGQQDPEIAIHEEVNYFYTSLYPLSVKIEQQIAEAKQTSQLLILDKKQFQLQAELLQEKIYHELNQFVVKFHDLKSESQQGIPPEIIININLSFREVQTNLRELKAGYQRILTVNVPPGKLSLLKQHYAITIEAFESLLEDINTIFTQVSMIFDIIEDAKAQKRDGSPKIEDNTHSPTFFRQSPPATPTAIKVRAESQQTPHASPIAKPGIVPAKKTPQGGSSAHNVIAAPPISNRFPELKAKHMRFIRDILNGEKNIKYQKVNNLITRMGGTIQEIGNGSSHKRIIINQQFAEIASPRVTGGIAKPHGKSHNSGVMSRFNTELVKSILKKAGFSKDMLPSEQSLSSRPTV